MVIEIKILRERIKALEDEQPIKELQRRVWTLEKESVEGCASTPQGDVLEDQIDELKERVNALKKGAENDGTDHAALFDRVTVLERKTMPDPWPNLNALEARADNFDGVAYKVDTLERDAQTEHHKLRNRVEITEQLTKTLIETLHSQANTLQVLVAAAGIKPGEKGQDLPLEGKVPTSLEDKIGPDGFLSGPRKAS